MGMGVTCINSSLMLKGKFPIKDMHYVGKEKEGKYLQLLFDPGLLFLSVDFTSTLHPIWHLCLLPFFSVAKYSDIVTSLLVDTHIVLTTCTTWPQKHTTWRTTGYKRFNFFFFCNISPTWIIVCLLKSCQNLNAVCPCYIPLFFGTVLIFLSVLMIDSFLFLFPSFVK